jgi:uncharacterized membrane protein YdbT with pleckstrin-like domain
MSDSRHVGTPEWLTLDPGETVHLRAAPSKNLLLAGIGGGMAMLVVVSVVVAALGDIATGRALSFAVLILVVAILGSIYLLVHRWEYAVTSDRICVARGLRSRETRAVPLDAVREVTLDQSRWQRLVNVGDLVIVTDQRTLRFGSVEDPRRVYERVLAHVE